MKMDQFRTTKNSCCFMKIIIRLLTCILIANGVMAKTAYDNCDINFGNCGARIGNILSFIPPLPEVPAAMTIGEQKHIAYNIINNSTTGKVFDITTNYETGSEIIREDSCTTLLAQTSCQIKLKIAPTKVQSLPLQLKIYANAGSIYLAEPIKHIITVNGNAPTIQQQPHNQTVTTGDQATFNIVATGTKPLHYSWSQDGQDIGADSDTFTISEATVEDAGSYVVTVSNDFGQVTSDAAILTVGNEPMITTQPQSQTIATGGQAAFSVVATGAKPLHYSWAKDGQPIGADSSTFTISAVTAEDAGSYAVTVSNDFGQVTSTAAALKVGDLPAITDQPQSQTATVGTQIDFSVIATGASPLHYQWYQGNVRIGTDANIYSIKHAILANAGNYKVTVANEFGEQESDPAVLTITTGIPVIFSSSNSNLLSENGATANGKVVVKNSSAYVSKKFVLKGDVAPIVIEENSSCLQTVAANAICEFNISYAGKPGESSRTPVSFEVSTEDPDGPSDIMTINAISVGPNTFFSPTRDATEAKGVYSRVNSLIASNKAGVEFLYAGTEQGVFKSNDGENWLPANGNLPNKNVSAFYLMGDDLYVGTYGGVFKTSNGGGDWQAVNTGLTGLQVKSLCFHQGYLYVGIDGEGVFRTNDGGKNWTPVNNGITKKAITVLCSDGQNLYAGVWQGGVFKTTDGNNWIQLDRTSSDYVTALYSDGVNLYEGTSGRGVFRTSNDGKDWTEINNGIESKEIRVLYTDGNYLYAGTMAGVVRTNDSGAMWSRVAPVEPSVLYTNTVYLNGDNLYIGTDGGGVYRIKSTGGTWQSTTLQVSKYVNFLYAYAGSIYAGTIDGGVFKSNDGGANWSQSDCRYGLSAQVIYADGGWLYAAFDYGVCKMSGGGNWIPINTGLPNKYTDFMPTALHAFRDGYLYLGINSHGVYRTNDGGTNWYECNGGDLNYYIIRAVSSDYNYVYAGAIATSGTSVFKSTGCGWFGAGLDNTDVSSLHMLNNYMFAGSYSKGVFRSNDGGTNWTEVNNGLTNKQVYFLHSRGNDLYAATQGGYVFRTSDNGENWVQIGGALATGPWALCSDNAGYLYVGAYGDGGGVSKINLKLTATTTKDSPSFFQYIFNLMTEWGLMKTDL